MALKDLSDSELRAKMSQRLTWLEKAYGEAARRLKERSNGGNDEPVKLAVRAEHIQNSLMATHSDATLLESDFCDLINEPMEITLLSER